MGTNDNSTTAPPTSSLLDLIHEAGFTGSAATTMYAIVMAESGGHADSHNTNADTGDNSYGLAQINMLGSMGPERLAQYHLSSNNDLFDPLTNLQVAYALSNGGTDFSPWTTYTRGTYRQYLTNQTANVTTGGSGSSGGMNAANAAGAGTPSDSTLATSEGDWSGLLQTVPQLKALLQKAISTGESVADFQRDVQQSDWWRTHNDEAKTLIGLQTTDPAEYTSQINGAKSNVSELAKQLGVTLTTAQLSSLATQSLIEGWDSGQLTSKVAGDINAATPLAGTYADNYNQLQTLYADYGLPISDATLRQRAAGVTGNASTLDTYKQQAINSAKGLYPSLGSQLDSGLTVKDIADPYIQTEANLLEINPDTIGITDPMVKKALQGTVSTTGGKSTATSTPLYTFEQQVRSDPRWALTNNAKDTVSSALLNIGQTFGFGPQG